MSEQYAGRDRLRELLDAVRLPAPNGIQFHPPTSLWVNAKEESMSALTEQLVAHDIDDTRMLLDLAKGLPDEDYALCDPPESFVISSVVAHVLTYSTHRRQLARQLIRGCGHKVDSGDPINWLRAQRGENPGEE